MRAISPGYGAHPVGDDEDGFVFNEPGQSLLNGSFVLHIQAGGGLVQQNDGRMQSAFLTLSRFHFFLYPQSQ